MGIDKWELNDKWDGERLGTKELYVKEGPEVERTGHKAKELLKEGHWGRASNQSILVFRSSWPTVGRVVWNGVDCECGKISRSGVLLVVAQPCQ